VRQVLGTNGLDEEAAFFLAQQRFEAVKEFLSAKRGEVAPKGTHLESLETKIEAGLADPMSDGIIGDVVDDEAEG
jgi:hypothetical protein